MSAGEDPPPVVLVHGGGFDHRCWDLLAPLLAGPALAVDLPGRGAHPAPLDEVTIAACTEAVVADVDAAGLDEVVLVGHSLAGCSLPSISAALGPRARHAVYVAATVPPDGQSALDTLDPEIQALVPEASPTTPATLDGELARMVLGDDLDEAQLAWCVERLVPESLRLTRDPVSLAEIEATPCTWVRTLQDQIVAPDKQARFAAQLPGCEVIDLDVGHMCMVSRPEALAAILDNIARR